MRDGDTPLRVAIAEDHLLVRDGLVIQLKSAGIDVVGAYGTADDLLANLETDLPNVVIVDIRLPPGKSDEGIRAAAAIRKDKPEIGILVLSSHCEPAYAEAVVDIDKAGLGYLVKDSVTSADTLIDAIMRIHARGYVIDPEVVQVLLRRTRNQTGTKGLTGREKSVMRLIAQGFSNIKIADELQLAVRTIESNTTNIFDKLGIAEDPDTNRRVQAVLAWLHGSQAP